jgi:hypothetical protein
MLQKTTAIKAHINNKQYLRRDGVLDDLEKTCAKYDVNGDGNFSIREVEMIVQDLNAEKRHSRQFARMAGKTAKHETPFANH